MTKQEEIREGIRLIWNDYKFGKTVVHKDSVWVVDAILEFLHSQGVVVKTGVNDECNYPILEPLIEK